jgi:HK97 family phage major capsid protein
MSEQPETPETPEGEEPETPVTPDTSGEVIEPAEEVEVSEELQASIAATVLKGVAPAIASTVSKAVKDAMTPVRKGVPGAQVEESAGKGVGTVTTKDRLSPEMATIKGMKALMDGDREEINRLNKRAKENREKAHAAITGDSLLDLRTKAAFQTGANTADGGALLLEPEIEKEIARLEIEYGVSFREADVRTLPGRRFQINRGLTNVSMVATAEGALKTGTKSTFDTVEGILRKFAGIALLTDELQEDLAVDLVKDITDGFANANALIADTIVFTEAASGAVQGGVLALDDGIITHSVGSTLADLNWNDLMDAEAKVNSKAKIGAKWYMHATVLNHLRQLTSSDDGHYILPNTFTPDGKNKTPFSGTEIVEVDVLPPYAAGVNNTPYLFYGNLKNCRLYTKGGLQLAYSNEASVPDASQNIIHTWAYDMQAIRGVSRMEKFIPIEQYFCLVGTGGVS